jgi:predicted patatin/cPLA2 family phospholipase
MKEELAIITSGGGLKCAFGVGVMLSLDQRYGLQEPPILISCSGSAGTSSYYVAKQYDSMLNIWSNLLSTKRFLNPIRFWKMMDIDYLIDEVFKKQDPLDQNEVYSSPIHYLIPAINEKTGRIHYFSNREGFDVFEAMRATKALPIVFKLNPNISIGGERYCDSILSSSAETHIEKAVQLGAKKILIVDPHFSDYSKSLEHRIFNLWVSAQNSQFRQGYEESQRHVKDYKIPEDITFYFIRPKQMLPLTTFGNNQISLIKAIQQGYEETSKNNDLAEFLN